MKLDGLEQRPTEDWASYMQRLERARIRQRAEIEERDAQVLEAIGEEFDDRELKTVAKAKRASAEEFHRAVEEMEKGAGG